MAKTIQSFDELDFFAQVKKRPGVFFGKPSLLSLRDYVFGMDYAFSFCTAEVPLHYFSLFVDWYHNTILQDVSGYACWWNHILYTCGHDGECAFYTFFRYFEQYLLSEHQIVLPSPQS